MDFQGQFFLFCFVWVLGPGGEEGPGSGIPFFFPLVIIVCCLLFCIFLGKKFCS